MSEKQVGSIPAVVQSDRNTSSFTLSAENTEGLSEVILEEKTLPPPGDSKLSLGGKWLRLGRYD